MGSESASATSRESSAFIQHAAVAGHRVTLRQDGEDTGTADKDGETFTRIIGFRASISG